MINAFGDKMIKAYVNNMREPLSFYHFIISSREAHLSFFFVPLHSDKNQQRQ